MILFGKEDLRIGIPISTRIIVSLKTFMETIYVLALANMLLKEKKDEDKVNDEELEKIEKEKKEKQRLEDEKLQNYLTRVFEREAKEREERLRKFKE
ncbi:Hypothetical protein BCO_0125700 (plasmid) [Borrelia coriaceae ATCC 43381]|uniref:Uncharacterized protein n=1 Tax=Borrelia coriaceae ATCC 43381 TaxID=1408429 RepID=W5SY16_9SPIR|nr:Hypothetical protein BCO_0125700 [Borrelia coriaceae ATCC 43381]